MPADAFSRGIAAAHARTRAVPVLRDSTTETMRKIAEASAYPGPRQSRLAVHDRSQGPVRSSGVVA